ncbi:MAG: aldehyde:ferredoxin oxidoreductase [Spirochaetes bacterium DG_61]|nr:MAG: aldehyde:ferredoxin oxidoreductase [Spirochaetes bacterium DG_61]
MKFIRVNMNEKIITVEDVPQDYMGLGGRGLTSIMINQEVPPKCDPLGPENKLIFAPGLLSGTLLPNTSRISVGAKSPLTGGIKESNAGGTASAALGRLGITAVVIEGQAPEGELSFLRIDEKGNASLIPAQEYKGMRTYRLVEKILKSYGEKTSVLCIGPAGEYRLATASIQSSDVDDHPCRAAARGGLGAVMGAKGLKALIVDQRGKSPDTIADPKAFREAVRAVVKIVKADHMNSEVMPKLGTAGLVAPVNSMGAFPSYNARNGVLDGWEKISGESMAELIRERGGKTTHIGCSGCIIHCSNEFVDNEGKYVTSSLEYETIWAMGGMTGIVDMDTIARLDNLCDDIGVDTMSTGVAVAVAMDAGYKAFGDGKAAIEMVEEIGKGTEFGKILGNGPAAVGKHFNHARVPVVKGQGIAAYDPRAMLGQGVTFSTSPMGADHTAGNMVGEYLERKLDPLKAEGQVEGSRSLQIAMAAFDSMGQCFMASVALLNPEGEEAFRKVINAKLGIQLGSDDFPHAMGIRVLKAEREFNRKAGFTNKDDRLPRFFYEEPLPPHNTVFIINDEEIDSTFDF